MDRRPLRRLLVAEAVSSLGTRMTIVALPWFVLQTTGSAAMTGVAFVAESLPVAVFGLLSGPVVGRLGALRSMVLSDWSRALLVGAVPVLHLAGVLTFPLLLVLLFAASSFFVPHFSAQRIALAEISPGEAETVRANGWLESAQQVAAVAGPAAAGVLIALIGAAEVLLVDAATFAVSAALVATVAPARKARRAAAGDEASPGGVLTGLRALVGDRPLAVLTAACFLIDVTFLPAIVIAMPVFVRELGEPASVLGVLLAAQAVGALAGALLLGRLSRHGSASLMVLGMALEVFTFAGLMLGLPLWLCALTLLVGGGGNAVCRSATMTILTRRTPPAVRPHVVTTFITLVVGSQPLGAAIGGPVVEAYGTGPVFVAGTAAFAIGLAAAIALAGSLREPVPRAEPLRAAA